MDNTGIWKSIEQNYINFRVRAREQGVLFTHAAWDDYTLRAEFDHKEHPFETLPEQVFDPKLVGVYQDLGFVPKKVTEERIVLGPGLVKITVSLQDLAKRLEKQVDAQIPPGNTHFEQYLDSMYADVEDPAIERGLGYSPKLEQFRANFRKHLHPVDLYLVEHLHLEEGIVRIVRTQLKER